MPEKEKKRRISKEKLRYLKNHLESKENIEPPLAENTASALVLISLISLLLLPFAYLLLW